MNDDSRSGVARLRSPVQPSKATGRVAEGGLHRMVELPDAREPCAGGDLPDGKIRFDDEASRDLNSMRSRNRQWRGSQMPMEQPPQVPRADSHTLRQLLQVALIQGALRDQLEGVRDHGPGAKPCRTARRSIGAAALASAKSSRLGGRGGLEPADVVRSPKRDRADRSAIHTRSRYSRKEAPIEALVAAVHGLPAKCGIQLQISAGRRCSALDRLNQPFSPSRALWPGWSKPDR